MRCTSMLCCSVRCSRCWASSVAVSSAALRRSASPVLQRLGGREVRPERSQGGRVQHLLRPRPADPGRRGAHLGRRSRPRGSGRAPRRGPCAAARCGPGPHSRSAAAWTTAPTLGWSARGGREGVKGGSQRARHPGHGRSALVVPVRATTRTSLCRRLSSRSRACKRPSHSIVRSSSSAWERNGASTAVGGRLERAP